MLCLSRMTFRFKFPITYGFLTLVTNFKEVDSF